MTTSTKAVPLILFSLMMLVPVSIEAGWKVSSSGKLVYEDISQGLVLGETTEIDEGEAQKLFNQLLTTADNSAYSNLLTADPELLQTKFSELVKNVEIYENANGELEAVVTDDETGVTSKSIVKDGQVITEITDTQGNVTEQVVPIDEEFSSEFDTSTSTSPAQDSGTPQKIKVTSENDVLTIGTEGQKGISDSLLEIEPNEESESVKIVSGDNGELIFSQGRVASKTNFPLSIDTEFNELIAETSKGEERVIVLPPAALSNILAANIIDEATGVSVEDQWTKDKVNGISSLIDLVEHEKGLAYKIEGVSNQKILGLFDAKVNLTVFVSVETGEVYQVERTFKDNLVDFFAI